MPLFIKFSISHPCDEEHIFIQTFEDDILPAEIDAIAKKLAMNYAGFMSCTVNQYDFFNEKEYNSALTDFYSQVKYSWERLDALKIDAFIGNTDIQFYKFL